MKYVIRLKGGVGSGHFGHKGRPGEQGGSLPKGESNMQSLYEVGDGGAVNDRQSMIEELNVVKKLLKAHNKDFIVTIVKRQGFVMPILELRVETDNITSDDINFISSKVLPVIKKYKYSYTKYPQDRFVGNKMVRMMEFGIMSRYDSW
jgi:hypothetical protein